MTENSPLISIIIPCKIITDYLRESITHILKLNYQNFEILILPDKKTPEKFNKSKIIATGMVKPGEKRNMAAQLAQGEILAFIDDDAYPKNDWLDRGLKHFKNPDIVAVGGPAITPAKDPFFSKVSGAVFLSWFSGANPDRFWPGKKIKAVQDWPTVNLIIIKKDFFEAGGFDKKFWPGEDTKLCLDLTSQNKKIIYEPNAIVFHHRRKGLIQHLKQIGAYGLHRGYFTKENIQNNQFKYFLPSLLFLFIIFGWLLLFLPHPFYLIYPALWLTYILALFISLIEIYSKIKDIKITLATIIYIPLTHLWYGFNFLKGVIRPAL